MDEQIDQSNQGAEEELTCPECGKGFQDMRGLTSHARNHHELNKDELKRALKKGEKANNNLKIYGAIGTAILALLTLGNKK